MIISNLSIAASNEGMEKTIGYYKTITDNPAVLIKKNKEYFNDLANNTLSIITPDSNFNMGYAWSKIATDQFFV